MGGSNHWVSGTPGMIFKDPRWHSSNDAVYLPVELQSWRFFRPNWANVSLYCLILQSFLQSCLRSHRSPRPSWRLWLCSPTFPVDVSSLLVFVLHPCLLASSPVVSMKILVPDIKSLLGLSQAKTQTPLSVATNHWMAVSSFGHPWVLETLTTTGWNDFFLPSMEMMSSLPLYSHLWYLFESPQPLHLAPDLKGPKFICFCNEIQPQISLR